MKQEKVTWETVFNTTHKKWGWLADAYEVAKNAEYPYFLWNDKVFTSLDATDTGWELEKGEFVDKNPPEEVILFI